VTNLSVVDYFSLRRLFLVTIVSDQNFLFGVNPVGY